MSPDRPTRVSRASRVTTAGRGYRLLLDGRTPIAQDDALLAAYGAQVVSLAPAGRDEDGLQDVEFAPGSPLCLRLAPTEEDRSRVEVVGASDLLPVDVLSERVAARVAAAIDHGLEQAALTVWERRDLATGDRVDLRLLVYSPAMVRVRPPKGRLVDVENFSERRRVVLAVERDGGLHWWDPTTTVGPLGVDGLGLSAELVEDLRALDRAWRRHVDGSDDDDLDLDFFCAFEEHGLEAKARGLWRRIRAELGPSFVVGWKPPGAPRAIYDEPVHASDDIPF